MLIGADVLKYEGNNNTLVYKHEKEDFNTHTQLIVHESQEAVFYMNGQALDLFGPGRYTLKTENIPILTSLLKLGSKGQNPFHCEVYFVNKTERMALKWGTDSQVQYMEPSYGFPISIGASGEMSLKVADSRKFLTKIVGTENGMIWDRERSRFRDPAAIPGSDASRAYKKGNDDKQHPDADMTREPYRDALVDKFRALLMTRVKTYIAQVIREKSIGIFEIDERLQEFSQTLQQLLIPDFLEYGLGLERFFVTTIVKPDGNKQYEMFKELHFRQFADIKEAQIRQQTAVINAQTEAQKTIIASQALATKRAQEGYTYQQERSFDVASQFAQNEGVGQFTNMGVGIGTMAGVGGVVGGVVSGSMQEAFGTPAPQPVQAAGSVQQPPATVTCMKCGATMAAGARFCMNCGTAFGNRCPECGADLPMEARFCFHCGAKLTKEGGE